MTVAIGFGNILLLSFIFYFVIKWAVKNGINQSMLFTDEQRKIQFEKEVASVNENINNKK